MGLFGKKKIAVLTAYPIVMNGDECACCHVKLQDKPSYQMTKDEFYSNPKYVQLMKKVLKSRRKKDTVLREAAKRGAAEIRRIEDELIEALKNKDTHELKYVCPACGGRFFC